MGVCSERGNRPSDSIKFRKISRVLDEIISFTGVGLLMTLDSIHDQLLYLVCPDLLGAVDETSYGIRVGFIGSTHNLHYLFIYLYLWCKVYSYPVKQTKIIFSQQKRK